MSRFELRGAARRAGDASSAALWGAARAAARFKLALDGRDRSANSVSKPACRRPRSATLSSRVRALSFVRGSGCRDCACVSRRRVNKLFALRQVRVQVRGRFSRSDKPNWTDAQSASTKKLRSIALYICFGRLGVRRAASASSAFGGLVCVDAGTATCRRD